MRVSNVLFCFALVVLLSGAGGAQVTLLSEDFSSASGNMPPPGWTAITNVGTLGTEEWRFDNPGGRPTPPAMTVPFAIWDDDFLSGSGQMSDGELISPAFNAGSVAQALLQFETEFVQLANTIEVDVFDGTNWNNVLSTTLSIPSTTGVNAGMSELQTIDITTAAAGASNARVRFHWVNGSWDWYWLIDDVNVFEPVMGAGQPPTAGFGTLDVNGAARDANNFPVSSGVAGPYFIALSLSAGDSLGLQIDGEPMAGLPSIVFFGRTLAGGVVIPGFGTIDLDPGSMALPIGIFGNGFATPLSLFDTLFFTNPTGDIDLTLPLTGALMGLSPISFSAINLTPTAPGGVTITNTTEVTINP